MSRPTVDTVLTLSQWGGQSFVRAQQLAASPEVGEEAIAEARSAGAAFGWLLGFLQDEIRHRPDEFVHLLAGDTDQALRDLLGGAA